MEILTYGRLFDFWIRHRKITIHMRDKEGRPSAFAISLPHGDDYIRETQRVIDRAEVFQIGCGEPMARQAFNEFLRSSETVGQARCKKIPTDSRASVMTSQKPGDSCRQTHTRDGSQLVSPFQR